MTLVPGYGSRNARIMFVGEAPAATEVKLGKPFQGKAGQQLNDLLRDAGINRDDCYVTNASLRPVSGDKDKFFFAGKGKPSENLIEGMKAFGDDLAEIKPWVVVPLGNYALWMLMQHQGIMSWRGSVLWSDLWNVKVVPTIHPAALLRNSGEPGSTEGGGGMWKMRPVVIWDLERAKYESRQRELERSVRTILINPIGMEHERAVARLLSAKRLTVDIESFGGTKLACIGFSDGDPNWAVVWEHGGSAVRTALFKSILESGIPIEGQNLMYDATMLDQNGIYMDNIAYDTMIAHHTLYPEFPKKLNFLTSIYTDIPYYKDEGKEWNKQPTAQGLLTFWGYCGKDVWGTAEVAIKQREELDERKLWHVMNRRMAVFQPCREATSAGWKCDHSQLDTFMKETSAALERSQARLNELAGGPVNINSPPQVKKLVFDKWGLPPRYKDNKLTTNEKQLTDIAAKSGHEGIGLIITCRKLAKLLGTYYNKKILSADGRIRYSFNIVGTRFGRQSSAAPLWGPGMNIQNIPIQTKYGRDARKMFIADDGMELAEFDQSQAEAIIVAYLADDPIHMDCFRHNKDVHRVTACYLVDMDPERWREIPKDGQVRDIAKKCNHALNYGEGWMTFMLNINKEYDPADPNSLHLDAESAKTIVSKYLQVRFALSNYWDGIKNELRNNQRTLVSPLGLPYTFLEAWSDTLLREAYSFKPQSTVGEQTNIAIARVMSDPEMRRMGVQFKAQVHDSAVFQWPKDNRQAILDRIWPMLETELYLNGYRVVIPWEGKVGQTWYKKDMEDVGVSRKCCEIGFEAAA